MAGIKKTIINIDKNVEKQEPSYTGGDVKWCSRFREQSARLKKVNDLSSSTAREMETYVHTKTCTQMFIAASFTIVKGKKQPKSPSVHEWIHKIWYIYLIECYSAIKRN